MSKIIYMGDKSVYADEASGDLRIPRPFVENSNIRQALYAAIYDFDKEEQKTILLHYWVRFSVEEVAELTERSPLNIACALVLYLEKLSSKLTTFDTATKDVVDVEDMFEVELWKQYEVFSKECETDSEYKARYCRTREAFSDIFYDKAVSW